VSDWQRDVEEDELPEPLEQKDEVPSDWEPSPETLQAIGGETDEELLDQVQAEQQRLHVEAERDAEALKQKFKPTQDTPVVGDTPEAKKLQEGFRRLGEVDSGRPIADTIREHGTTIHFGPLEPGTVAQFDHQTNESTVNEGLKDASPNVLAAHLAHEGTHVQWVRDSKGYNTEDEIVNAEYAALKNQADV
jgi:hypothetical protein